MCFSPEADLVGGIVITAIGLDALRHVDGRKDHLAIASLPLVLGLHQIDEAFVWWGLSGDVPATVGRVALWLYLLIAFVLLPAGVPLAVRSFEPDGVRQRLMTPFALVGGLVGGYLLFVLLQGPIGVRAEPYHLAYSAPIAIDELVVVAYVGAVCGALLLSSYRHVLIFGVANLIAVGVIARLTIDGFASVWCAYAAVVSGVIAAHMRYGRRWHETRRVPTAA